MQQQTSHHNSPVEKKPSPTDNQCMGINPPYSYICMVKSFSQQPCNNEFDEMGPLKAHLRSIHGLPMPNKNIEYYYRKKENKS